MSNFEIENQNNDERGNNLSKKRKEIETQKSEKSILFNNLILRKKNTQRNPNNFNEFLAKSKFNTNESHNNEENDDILVVQYLSNKESEENSYDYNVDNNINDSIDINKTESNIEDEPEGKKEKKVGISIHKINKKNKNNKMVKFEKDNDLDDFIYYRNKELNLEEKKSKGNQRNILENQINHSIKINSLEKRNLNQLSTNSLKKRKISFNEPSIHHSDKLVVRSIYNPNNNLKINQIISLDDESEINIEKNKEKEKYIETIIPVDKDIKFNNNKRKKNMKGLNSNLKLDNKSQMISTEVLISSNDKKLKNMIKKKKDKETHSSIQMNKRKRPSNNAPLNNLSNKRKEFDLNKNENKIGNMKLKDKKVSMAYTDEELQDMEFEEALRSDNRSFIRIYWSFLIDEHIIINNVFSDVYLDLRVIKLSFLFFSLMISFFLNSFFYTDDYISESYHNNGVLNFVTSLPKAIYSFFVTIIISNLLKMLSSNKKNMKELIKEKLTKMEYLKRMEYALKKLKVKLIIYFICLSTLGIFFLYYITAFCAVYQNSQYYWIYGCLESFFLDMATPFIISLFLSCFRYIGLIKHSSFFYSLSSFLSNIL